MIANGLISTTTRHLAKRLRTLKSNAFSSTASTSNIFEKIAFLGTGKMSQAMLSPLITQNLQCPSSITAYDVSDAALSKAEELFPGIRTAKSIPDAISDSNLIIYGVKPQNVAKVHAEIRRAKLEGVGNVRDDAIILSVVAGTPIQSYIDGALVSKVARSMPNTPAQIGCGVTVWSCTENVDANERKKIKSILDSFGKTVYVDDESFIDMSTSISGSGPAYIFLLMEAMIDAGVHMGFNRDTATTLVHHTLLGSTKFAMETGEHPGKPCPR
jgi:pyrroline-5-carboxylate reductase